MTNLNTNNKDMVYLKEDGSVDVERINKLPLIEWMDMVGEMTKEQFEYFESKTPLIESNEPYMGVEVDDETWNRIMENAIDGEELLNGLRSKLRTNEEM